MTSLIAGGLHQTAAILGALISAPAAVLIVWAAWHVTKKGND